MPKTAVDVRPSRLTAKPTTVPITNSVKVPQLLLMEPEAVQKYVPKQNAIPLNASARACLKEAFCKNFSNRFQKIAANSKTAPAQMCEGLLISIHYLFLKKSGIWISFF